MFTTPATAEGFDSDDTLIAYYDNSYYKRTIGDDVIVAVDDFRVTLSGAAILRYTNVDFRKAETIDEPKENSWKLDGTTATYGDLTVKGVTSLDGLSVNGKVVTVSKNSLGTGKVTISDGYTLKLGDDVSGSTTKKSWTLSGATATYKQTKTAGYSLSDNTITYTKKTSKTLATVKGATSLDGISVSGKTIKLAASALSKKVTVSGAYTFDFASDYSTATITGSSANDTITARGKKISVKGNAGDDTIKLLGTGTISGGSGSDIFAVNSTAANIISDYAEEDKISLTSGAADFSVSGDDLIINGKISLTGAADKSVTYIEGGVEKIFENAAEDVLYNAAKTSATLTADFMNDNFVADSTLVTIDASAVVHELNITGNKLANSILGSEEDDTIDGGSAKDTIRGGDGNDEIFGGKGNDKLYGGDGRDSLWGGLGEDTLTGGAGYDIFIYQDGDGRDLITDYKSNVDKIMILSGRVENPTSDGTDVTFKVGDGQIVIAGGASKYIELHDGSGNKLTQKFIPH